MNTNEIRILDVPTVKNHAGIGIAIGEEFRSEIQEAVNQRHQGITSAEHLGIIIRARGYANKIETNLPRTWNMLVGITVGADIPLMEGVLLNTHELQDPTERCLTVVSPNQNSSVIGQIEEWNEPGAENLLYILKTKIQEGSYTRALLGLCYKTEFPWTAISLNEVALVQAINSLESYQTGPGIPRIAIACALAESENLESAAKTINNLPRASAFNHVFVQKNRIVNIEAANGHLTPYRLTGEPFVHANHFTDDNAQKHGPLPSEKSLTRYNRARQTVRPNMSFAEMSNFLSQHQTPETLASIIVEPEHGRLSARRNYKGAQFAQYTL